MVMVAFGVVVAGGCFVVKAMNGLYDDDPKMNCTGYNHFGW